MMRGRLLLLPILALLAAPVSTRAQVASAIVTSSCGTPQASYAAGRPGPQQVDQNGNLCIGGPGSPVPVVPGGTTGTDYGANTPTLPNIGANFGGSGPYANFVLIKTVPASLARGCVYIANSSGVQIAVVTDDGTAGSGQPPNNGGVFPLLNTYGAGNQGGATDPQFCYFKGRVQVYAPSTATNPQVYIAVW